MCRYDNWVAALVDWQRIQGSEEWHEWIVKAFEAFDADHSGTIEFEELQRMLCQDTCVVSWALAASVWRHL